MSHNEDFLHTNQLEAIDLLTIGMDAKDVAIDLNIARETISRWRKNPYFTAALKKRQAGMQQKLRRFDALVDRSLDLVENAVKDGDVKTALAMLSIMSNIPKSIPQNFHDSQNSHPDEF